MVYKILWPGFLVIKVLANLKVIILMALQTAIVKHEAQFYGNYGLITLLYNLTFPSLNYHHWNVFALLLSSQVSCTECRTRRKTLLAQTPRVGTFCFLTSHLGARQWTILCRNMVIEFCSIMHSGSTCLCLWVKLPTGCGWDWNCWIAWEKTWKTGIPKPISGICSNRECRSIYGEFLGLVFWTPVMCQLAQCLTACTLHFTGHNYPAHTGDLSSTETQACSSPSMGSGHISSAARGPIQMRALFRAGYLSFSGLVVFRGV